MEFGKKKKQLPLREVVENFFPKSERKAPKDNQSILHSRREGETQKEHYSLRRVKARKKGTKIPYFFFGIHTANTVRLAGRLPERQQTGAAWQGALKGRKRNLPERTPNQPYEKVQKTDGCQQKKRAAISIIGFQIDDFGQQTLPLKL